ncbi:RelA/SpoT domain-containing protein [Streptomyces sp. NBC_01016]|uniref:RelA/SpoT domain-containing protein n=1 Tax=Streptomyces sp. NBC_01016 TaxID=2903720 RepID=UPI00224E90DD|nr:RelA/SpoT domain-containing protein [Streptomyces sp. NBC_01016]MCX4834362.1 RelA/SpoT domain-containing protein [Streptomyces sp. NBC_01016]
MPLTAGEAFQRYREERPCIERAAEATKAHLEHHIARRGIDCQVTARAKELTSFNAKARSPRKNYADPWKEITDKAGVRVIVPHSGLLNPALDVIKDNLTVVEVQDYRDDVGKEDLLRYPRLHVQAVVVGGIQDPDGAPYECEIQLRTEAIDLWSRMSHKLLYKPGVSPPADVSRSLYRLIALVELFDLEVERGWDALAQQDPELARGNRLLKIAEHTYRTFTDHPYSRDLSQDVIEVLSQTIDDAAAYSDQLAEFTERFRERIQRNYADYGPTSAHFLQHGRYLLASQPESLIIFERLANARFRLKSTWKKSELPETMLTDMAQIWGTAL